MTSFTQSSILLSQAVKAVFTKSLEKPAADQVVEALVEQEKTASKQKQPANLSQFVGTWRLCFITGTQKTRRKIGTALGAGRYLPNWVKIHLSYSVSVSPQANLEQPFETGKVENSVQLGGLKLTLSGPVKFLAKKNILAFDFTRMNVILFGVKLYDGYIRGGAESEEKFYSDRINKQAFFAYFYIQEKAIAARGRGGGLALWGREN
ncbi:MAG: hypothetical protein WAN66_24015 [Limnoraphis robusta]|uniref:Plastid lipid-associated protein/fibrillin conserved domain-containing protein n=2 Tax=Limnoraphis robusta TaxID=1118279 RepID=A0A0F5YLN5_9CYAN|nr:hypothetical protein [Limnoraphis robusta]KKD39678.1 hypothetical protein WN50_02115 [Limnoraphis robusta CS-951]MEA5520205.1 hypothetical protein [Limnoraphis robusta CCNP1315]MEA5542231.1 hypothetical protein [Limnoraphis robusta Tam1]MEA5546741.1 hypothetical protein [Limnoraphis robusta CCNP1324]